VIGMARAGRKSNQSSLDHISFVRSGKATLNQSDFS
jgi:hypothetical protein